MSKRIDAQTEPFAGQTGTFESMNSLCLFPLSPSFAVNVTPMDIWAG